MIYALITLLISSAGATTWQAQHEAIWDVAAAKYITLEELAAKQSAGEILVLGEDHATTANAAMPETYIHHRNQLRLIQSLHSFWHTVSVGMEFLTYPHQAVIDPFIYGTMPEADFLKAVGWNNGNPFEFYREQIYAPRWSGGQTVALNIPMSVTDHVATGGKDSLSAAERRLLPPLWEQGNAGYYARFAVAMADHCTPAQLPNYFWAQSLWDDTMAWKALQYRASAPNDIMVIIVGAFHVQYGGGLPFEMRQQGGHVKTVLQVQAPNWKAATLRQLVQPDPQYGAQADYLWLHSGAVAGP